MLLSDPDVIGDQQQFRKLSIELSEIEPVVETFAAYESVSGQIEEARLMLEDDDTSMREMAKEELPELEAAFAEHEATLQKLLLPKDPNDSRNIFLEIRAGTGGDEAAIFSGDLFRMYNAYAESRGWKVEIMSRSKGSMAGSRKS